MVKSAWGDKETEFFYNLTPEKILDAVEKAGFVCSGRVLQLNSMENRVFEVEIDLEERPKHPYEAFRIAKFYRPGRWTEDQIAEEHQFLLDLKDNDLPAVAPLELSNGKTYDRLPDSGIIYTIFPKVGGRNPQELEDEQLQRLGRLLARMHNVGAIRKAEHRIKLTPETYGMQGLKYLLDHHHIPEELKNQYKTTVETICDASTTLFKKFEVQRIHGDAHLGNLLWGQEGPFWVDFDDMVVGPPVQDLWLIAAGRDEFSLKQRSLMVDAYDMMKPFEKESLILIEPLRALRMVHFSAWIAKRWKDSAFPRTFPHFNTWQYWKEQLVDLEEQKQLICAPPAYREW